MCAAACLSQGLSAWHGQAHAADAMTGQLTLLRIFGWYTSTHGSAQHSTYLEPLVP